jgi:hypothetical protein
MLLTACAQSQAPAPVAAESQHASNALDCAPAPADAKPIDDAKLYVEFNSTDEDLGIHGYLGDDGWTELCVYNPGGELMLAIKPQAQLGSTTLASVFFEGREPSLDEFGFEELKSFPEGRYAVRALSHDGTSVSGEATFSRNVPAPPELVFPAWAEEEGAEDVVMPTDGFSVEWEPVTETTDGNPVTLSGYEVIITKVEHDDPHGFSLPVYDVHLGPEKTLLSVPPEFLEQDTLYELEILAIEESGNQTITVSFFMTE